MTTCEIPDVNVLVAWVLAHHQDHAVVQAWAAEEKRFATTPITEAGLVRLLLNPLIAGAPMTVGVALDILRSIREAPGWSFLADDSSLAVTTLSLTGLHGHRQITDAHLVALAHLHGARVVTLDRKIAVAMGAGAAHAIRTL